MTGVDFGGQRSKVRSQVAVEVAKESTSTLAHPSSSFVNVISHYLSKIYVYCGHICWK